MKCYVCSIGQKTTDICKEQLEKFGFEVIVSDEKESWQDKYKRFIALMNEDCIRIDADVIPNEKIKDFYLNRPSGTLMAQAKGYDFYKNDIGVIGIVFYNMEALEIIRNNLDKIDWRRPEATAWRLPEINDRTYTSNLVCGMHGFFQTNKDLERHKQHKIERKQIEDYNFELANKLSKINLCQK